MKPDGGPAFPHYVTAGGEGGSSDGIGTAPSSTKVTFSEAAKEAFKYADAMLAERDT